MSAAVTVSDYEALLGAAKRHFARAVVINQSSSSPPFPIGHLVATGDRIKLAERTAKGGCFLAAYRMLQGVAS